MYDYNTYREDAQAARVMGKVIHIYNILLLWCTYLYTDGKYNIILGIDARETSTWRFGRQNVV